MNVSSTPNLNTLLSILLSGETELMSTLVFHVFTEVHVFTIIVTLFSEDTLLVKRGRNQCVRKNQKYTAQK